MSAVHQLYSASLAAADDAHKDRMKEALAVRAAAVLSAQAVGDFSDNGTAPSFGAALIEADFAHFEALRSSEARRRDDRVSARAIYREGLLATR
jgi:hypothetical protein